MVLMGLWVLLSGIYTPFHLGLGLGCSLLVACTLRHLDVTSTYKQYPQIAFRFLAYLPWLFVEIVRSSLDVTRYAWGPLKNISPNIAFVPAKQKTPMGLVIFANSITLTPGTLSIDIQDNEVEVHSMTLDMHEVLLVGEMNRRVAKIEGAQEI